MFLVQNARSSLIAPWKQRTLVALTTCLLAACSTSQQMSDAQPRPFALDTSDWPEERRALEEDFHTWLGEFVSFDAALRQSMRKFNSLLQERSAGQQALDARLRDHLKGSTDPDLRAWGTLRLAQTYLNFACLIEDIHTPSGITAEQAREFRNNISTLVSDLFAKTATTLNATTEQGVDTWSHQADYLLQHLDPPTSETCESTLAFWRP
ncbi:hypothetical protein FRC98_15785 [Lujinxingia vulgaris]|uniref:Uncharacterized protein n=1 Tax=Lujinxingia vulgaris TaxID=2600176 RepID=A0A5C6XE64_9DELT|nr:hypothetical protein [Lujinxingia vulgaris]TXD35665.1 hypothetical protein FRC98_15785 [Lujinxingia vulgaris]